MRLVRPRIGSLATFLMLSGIAVHAQIMPGAPPLTENQLQAGPCLSITGTIHPMPEGISDRLHVEAIVMFKGTFGNEQMVKITPYPPSLDGDFVADVPSPDIAPGSSIKVRVTVSGYVKKPDGIEIWEGSAYKEFPGGSIPIGDAPHIDVPISMTGFAPLLGESVPTMPRITPELLPSPTILP